MPLMSKKERGAPVKPLWTYAYEIVPPQSENRFGPIKALLDRKHADAHRETRTWAGRMVLANLVTHILVVSDSPEQNTDVNRQVEAQLKELNVGFSLIRPLAVIDDAAPVIPRK